MAINYDKINYDKMPQVGARDIIRDYIEHGHPLEEGEFYYELVVGDLHGAFQAADLQNTLALRDWAAWFYNYAPADCYGSKEIYEAWIQRAQRRKKRNKL